MISQKGPISKYRALLWNHELWWGEIRFLKKALYQLAKQSERPFTLCHQRSMKVCVCVSVSVSVSSYVCVCVCVCVCVQGIVLSPRFVSDMCVYMYIYIHIHFFFAIRPSFTRMIGCFLSIIWVFPAKESYIYIHCNTHTHINLSAIRPVEGTAVLHLHTHTHPPYPPERAKEWYGLATISRLLMIIGLFCERAL